MIKKDGNGADRHTGCVYRHTCRKVEEWCPYLLNNRHTCKYYVDNYLWK